MILSNRMWNERKPPMPRSLAGRVAWMTSIASLSLCCGCAHSPILVIPADREVRLLPAGRSYTATHDVYLVPPARMQEILHALSDRASTP